MDPLAAHPHRHPPPASHIAERLRWLLGLRWAMVPVFVGADLASGHLLGRARPWSALAVGGALLLLNAVYALGLARAWPERTLLAWARLEAALVVALPVAAVVVRGDPASPLRYGVLVGVVGAAVVLPRAGEVAVVGLWACLALALADGWAAVGGAGEVREATFARWAIDSGVVLTVAFIAGYLHQLRERAERRLRELLAESEAARQEWEATFENLHDMVLITDAAGVVTRANQAFATALGLRPQEIAGRRLEDLLQGHPPRWWTDGGEALCEIDDPVFDTLYEVATTRVAGRTIRVARDVGEQRRLYARLVQADKLAAVGILASGVAHEINNPTAFVTSNLSELRRYVQSYESAFSELSAIALEAGRADRVSAVLHRPEVAFARREAQSALGESLTGMERIRQIVTNLRSLARRDQAGEPTQPVELSDVVDAVVRTAAQDLRAAHARVEVQDRVAVMGHRGELVDVVLNLVVNAIQAREPSRPNHITVELKREGPYAVVRVSDTGRGIPPTHVKRLFEPFFTTKAPGEGTGLGLSLARNIVLAHGGAIDVATQVGEGTTFTVRLPAIDDATSGAGLRRGGGTGAARRGG
jgi:signal transduction histidine kinase